MKGVEHGVVEVVCARISHVTYIVARPPYPLRPGLIMMMSIILMLVIIIIVMSTCMSRLGGSSHSRSGKVAAWWWKHLRCSNLPGSSSPLLGCFGPVIITITTITTITINIIYGSVSAGRKKCPFNVIFRCASIS